MNGELFHLSAGGLYNGLVLLYDDETGSYWDHITGECVHGPMKGNRLDDAWTITVTTVNAALAADPELVLLRSRPGLFGRLMGWFMLKGQIRGSGMMPWYFYTTMEKRDRRRDRMDQGLGVVVDGRAVYYPHGHRGSGRGRHSRLVGIARPTGSSTRAGQHAGGRMGRRRAATATVQPLVRILIHLPELRNFRRVTSLGN